MSYNKLYFNAIDFVRLEDGIGIWLQCPVCKRRKLITRSIGRTFPAVFDVNRQVSFTIPAHDNKEGLPCDASGCDVSLFVAVHRDANGIKICLQRTDAEGANGIASDWWVTEQ